MCVYTPPTTNIGPFSRNTLIFGFVTHYKTLYTYKYLSNEKNPGWLGYKGDYTTQLYRDYKKPL